MNSRSTLLLVLLCVCNVVAWQPETVFPRRAFLAVSASALMAPSVASAYERRDVGGADRSAEQAAYNEQAYETNNRLEREGFKLETAAEQKASLTAALSDYEYSGTSDNKKTNKKSKNKK